jgi:hypothetical protein
MADHDLHHVMAENTASPKQENPAPATERAYEDLMGARFRQPTAQVSHRLSRP